MIPARQDSNLLLLDFINEPMLMVDPARPATRQFVSQRFWFG
jgi:hypothetical protein